MKKEFKWRWYPRGYDNICFRLSLYLFTTDIGFSISLHHDCENTIQFCLYIPYICSIYFTIESIFGYKQWWQKLLMLDNNHKWGGRQFSIKGFNGDSIDGYCIIINIWSHTDSWNKGDLQWVLYPSRLIFGDYKYVEYPLENKIVKIILNGDETYSTAIYELKIRKFLAEWKSKRFNKTTQLTKTEINCDEGIPHPGKGTTSYNCDEDKTYSMITCESNIDKAIEQFIGDINYTRLNYPL